MAHLEQEPVDRAHRAAAALAELPHRGERRPALAAKVRGRHLLDADEEWAVRRAAFTAVGQLCERSGRSMGAVDWFLFQMRHRCPEVSTPVCAQCPANPACEHRVELFQPVRRTTYY